MNADTRPYATTLVIAAVAAVVFATGADASRATPRGTNGRIAFQRYLFQDKPLQADIFAANADGSLVF